MRTIILAVLCVHPPTVAATRLRAAQYAAPLADAGIQLRLWSFFREDDLEGWYGSSHLRRIGIVLRALLRLPAAFRLMRTADIVLVQREALPLGPPVLEWFASRRSLLVWDVDDAVWTAYVSPTAGRVPRWLRATGDKYQRVCSWADEVWAGSEVLADWCRNHNPNVEVVPTVVDVPSHRPEPTGTRTVGWIGSHSTGLFLEAVLPAVSNVSPQPNVIVVGARTEVPEGLDVEFRQWSPPVEDAALSQTRVGLYPIDMSHPLAEGKCGLKAILYMSRGIPPVVTPTQTNSTIVRHGRDGLHAVSSEEWTTCITRLLDDEALWESCSETGYERARHHFSLSVWAPFVADRIDLLVVAGAEESETEISGRTAR